MKKLLLVSAILAIGALFAYKLYAQAVIIGGYPVFNGSFQQAGPLPSNFGIYSAQTNTAALSRTANPLTTGNPWTNGAVQGFLTVNIIATNSQQTALINLSTGQTNLIGSVSGGGVGTNCFTATIRVGPSEIAEVTNQTSTPNLLSSEFRN